MKKTMRKVAITAASALLTFSVGALIAENKNVFVASAETVAVEQNFMMQDGASIRIMSNTPSGIRWSVNVSKAYYEYVQSAAAGNSFEFGTYVDETPIKVAEGNVVSSTAIKIPCTTSDAPKFDEKTGVWTYNASILYSELAQEIRDKLAENGITDEVTVEQKVETALQQAYKTILYARGYAKIGDTYEYAVDGDTGRSVRGVAMHCLIENTSDVTTSNKTSFETYAGGAYTVEETETFGDENAYSLTEKAGTITSANELTAGDYAVYAGAKKITDITLSADGKISATVTGLGSTAYEAGKGYKLNFINSENEVYQVPFLVATHVIDTKDEFISYMNSWSEGSSDGAKTETNTTADHYVVLTDNIDLDGTTFTKTQADFFSGTFNGLGHTLSNAKVNISKQSNGQYTGGGLFGFIAATGVVENVAVVDITCPSAYIWMISGKVYGHIRNIYVEGVFSTANGNGVIRGCHNDSIENVIVNVMFTDTTTKSPSAYGALSTIKDVKNSYAIGNAPKFSDASSGETRTVYADAATFLSTEKVNITATNGWNKYWAMKGGAFYFGDTLIVDTSVQKDTLYTAQSTIDLTTLTNGEEVVELMVNGQETAVPADGVYDLTGFTYGKVNYLTVTSANGETVTQPIVTATHAIGTKDEFIAYMNSWTGGSSDGAKSDTNQTADHYVVLTDNIGLDGTTFTKTQADFFSGTFNGLGHTLSNMSVNIGKQSNGSYTSGGLFGHIATSGVVENLAIVDIDCKSGWNCMISNQIYGHIRNIYVEGVFSTANGNGVMRGRDKSSVQNVIVNVTFTDTTTKSPSAYCVMGGGAGSIVNSYAIGNAPKFSDASSGETRTVYAAAATFLSTEKANITATNGWSEYWNFSEDGNTLYFGEKTIVAKIS